MATELKITKCIAASGYVIVYFSEPVDFVGGADPTAPGTYHVRPLIQAPSDYKPKPFVAGPALEVTSVFFDSALRKTAILQLSSVRKTGEMLWVEVNPAITSNGQPISGSGRQYSVKVNAKDKATDDEQLKKILQPPYAIGMGLITRDDYNSLKNEYFSQSELSLGLILPMILIVLGLVLTPQLGLTPQGLASSSLRELQTWLRLLAWALMCLLMIPLSQSLFLIGMERYHKFRLELKLLILGNWQKQQDTKKAADSGSGITSSKPKPPSPGDPGTATNINVGPLTVDIRSNDPGSPTEATTPSGKPDPGGKRANPKQVQGIPGYPDVAPYEQLRKDTEV